MPACQLYFVLGVILFLLGLIGLVLRTGQVNAKTNTPTPSFKSTQILFLVTMLAGAAISFNNLSAYVNCNAKAGACPSSFPAGSTGYTCTNEYEQCAYSKNCITVKGKYFWESDCECKCINTSD